MTNRFSTFILLRLEQPAEFVLEHLELFLDHHLLARFGECLLLRRVQVQLTALVLLLQTLFHLKENI